MIDHSALRNAETAGLTGRAYGRITLGVVALGVLLRGYHYLDNRSLWGDETFLALNLIERSFAGLTQSPLSYEQYAPLGFLWAEKLFISLFGIGEMALRLFPFLCGLLALFGYVRLTRRVLSRFEALVALLCLAVAHPVIYYSVETKQYQTEMLVTIGLYLAYFHFKNRVGLRPALAWGAIGALALWFAYPSVFILAGIALALLIPRLLRRDFRGLGPWLLPFTMWGVSFLVNYFLFISVGTRSDFLADFWRQNFLPLPPKSTADLLWFVKTPVHLFDNPLGVNWQLPLLYERIIRFSVVGLVFLGIGIFRMGKRQPDCLVFTLPLLLLGVASGLGKYPLFERFLLFYTPVLFIFMARGAGTAGAWLSRKNKLAAALIGLFLAPLVANSAYQLFNRDFFGLNKRRETREAFAYVAGQHRPGELVYLHWKLRIPLLYYGRIIRFPATRVEGVQSEYFADSFASYVQHYENDMKGLKGKGKVWMVLSTVNKIDPKYVPETGDIKEAELIKSLADKYGRVVGEQHFLDAVVYVYDFP
jgi:hypothetical protein